MRRFNIHILITFGLTTIIIYMHYTATLPKYLRRTPDVNASGIDVSAVCHGRGADPIVTGTKAGIVGSDVVVETGNEAQLRQAWGRVPVLDSPKLPRLLTGYNVNVSLELCVSVRRVFEDYGIEYVMAYGTLLGSYVSHSILPWDDDLDWIIHVRHQQLLMDLAANGTLERYGLSYKGSIMAGSDHHKSKLWHTKAAWQAGRPWRHPFLDVITYDTNATHMWINNMRGLSLLFPRETIYPLQQRPLNGFWFSVPREPYAFLSSNYLKWQKQFRTSPTDNRLKCAWNDWNHWTTNGRRLQIQADCGSLLTVYPFARRTKLGPGKVEEQLVVANVTYYTIITEETFETQWQPEPDKLHWVEYWPRMFLRNQTSASFLKQEFNDKQ